MNTKIYELYRLPIPKLNDFLKSVRLQVFRNAAKKIKENSNLITDKHRREFYLPRIEEIGYNVFSFNNKEENFKIFIYFANKMAKTSFPSEFNLEYSLDIWIDKDKAFTLLVDDTYKIIFPDYCENCLCNYLTDLIKLECPIIFFNKNYIDKNVGEELYKVYKEL